MAKFFVGVWKLEEIMSHISLIHFRNVDFFGNFFIICIKYYYKKRDLT